MKKQIVLATFILLMICSMIGAAVFTPQRMALADAGGTHDCEPWPSCKNATEPAATTIVPIEPSVTENPSNDPGNTEEPCGLPGQSPCGQGDHGQGDPDNGSEHANCHADQGEVDPSCTPTVVPTGETETATVVPTGETETATVVPTGETETATVVPTGETETATVVPTGETETATVVPTQVPTTEPTTCGFLARLLGKCGKPSVTTCVATEPVLYAFDNDVFSLTDPITDTTPTNLTDNVDYNLSNPDNYKCQYVAEAVRNGQKDIALLDVNGLVRWLTDSAGDETSPTFKTNGNVTYTNAAGIMYEITTTGKVVKELGKGFNPINSNYTADLVAYTLDGDIFINGSNTGLKGIPDEWRADGALFYISGDAMWLRSADGTTESIGNGVTHVAPKPGSVSLDTIASVKSSTKMFFKELPIWDGGQQDWYGK